MPADALSSPLFGLGHSLRSPGSSGGVSFIIFLISELAADGRREAPAAVFVVAVVVAAAAAVVAVTGIEGSELCDRLV